MQDSDSLSGAMAFTYIWRERNVSRLNAIFSKFVWHII